MDGTIIEPLISWLCLLHPPWIPPLSIHLGMLLACVCHSLLRLSIHHVATVPRSYPFAHRGGRRVSTSRIASSRISPPIAIMPRTIAIFPRSPVFLGGSLPIRFQGSATKGRDDDRRAIAAAADANRTRWRAQKGACDEAADVQGRTCTCRRSRKGAGGRRRPLGPACSTCSTRTGTSGRNARGDGGRMRSRGGAMLTRKDGVDLCSCAGNFSWADCRGRPPKVSRARRKPWCQDTLSEDTCANGRRAHDETIQESRRWTDAKIGTSKRSIRPATPDDLRAYFETYGEVVEAPIMKDRGTGRPRGFGFVVFADPDVAEKVASEEHTINGRQVEAKKAVPREGDSNGARQQPQMQTQGKPNADATAAQQGQGIRTKKIFVGGLPPTITEDTFRAYFEEFGQIQDAVVMYDHATNRPRGFGFVTFETEESVDKVFEQGNMHELNEKKVEIKRAVPKDQMPPGPQRGPRPPYPAGPMPGVGQRQMGMQGSYGRGFNAGYGAHGALGGAALGAFSAGYGSGFAGASQTYSAYSSVVAGQPGGFTPGYTPPTNYSQAAATGTGYSQQQAGQSPQQPPPGYAQTPYSQLYQHGASFGGYNQIGAFGAYDAAAYGASAHPPGTNVMQQGEMQEGGVGGSFNHFGVQSGYAPADGREWQ